MFVSMFHVGRRIFHSMYVKKWIKLWDIVTGHMPHLIECYNFVCSPPVYRLPFRVGCGVRSLALEDSVKSFVNEPSNKFNFNEFLFMWSSCRFSSHASLA